MEEYPNLGEDGRRPRRTLLSAFAILALLTLTFFLLWEAGLIRGLLESLGLRIGGGRWGWDWQELDLGISLKLRSAGVRNLEVRMVQPPHRSGFQELALDLDPDPQESFREGDRVMVLHRFDFPPQEVALSLKGRVLLRRMDLETAMRQGGYTSGEALSSFLASEELVESDDPEIRALAAAVGGETDREMAAEICRLVGRLLDYRRETENRGALAALRRGWGNCTDYSHLMVALCRAKGIPARTARGLLVERSFGEGEFGEFLHRWVEVHLEGCGWVTFDPTLAEEDPTMVERLPPFHLLLGVGEGDPWLKGGDMWFVESRGGSVEAEWDMTAQVKGGGKGELPHRTNPGNIWKNHVDTGLALESRSSLKRMPPTLIACPDPRAGRLNRRKADSGDSMFDLVVQHRDLGG